MKSAGRARLCVAALAVIGLIGGLCFYQFVVRAQSNPGRIMVNFGNADNDALVAYNADAGGSNQIFLTDLRFGNPKEKRDNRRRWILFIRRTAHRRGLHCHALARRI